MTYMAQSNIAKTTFNVLNNVITSMAKASLELSFEKFVLNYGVIKTSDMVLNSLTNRKQNQVPTFRKAVGLTISDCCDVLIRELNIIDVNNYNNVLKHMTKSILREIEFESGIYLSSFLYDNTECPELVAELILFCGTIIKQIENETKKQQKQQYSKTKNKNENKEENKFIEIPIRMAFDFTIGILSYYVKNKKIPDKKAILDIALTTCGMAIGREVGSYTRNLLAPFSDYIPDFVMDKLCYLVGDIVGKTSIEKTKQLIKNINIIKQRALSSSINMADEILLETANRRNI